MNNITRSDRINFLNEHFTFPTRIAFHVGNPDGKMRILTTEYTNKKNLANIRLNELLQLNTCGMAVIDVREIYGAEELLGITDFYRKLWNIEI